METPLNASSTTASTLMSSWRFRIPPYQREYAWGREEVGEFWSDLHRSLNDQSYFLGLVILTGDGPMKDVVDGQQRLLTLTVLASALHHEAVAAGRRALADRIRATFLKSINFDTDEENPRIVLSASSDNETLVRVLDGPVESLNDLDPSKETVSAQIVSAYSQITDRLREDIREDAFRYLGAWADFLTNRLYFANFLHPDPASAYRVFEVVNTRGKELTTADLLKNYVLSETPEHEREQRYLDWQELFGQFKGENSTTFVPFIRHAVTVERGHIPPKDLYDVLSGRSGLKKQSMDPDHLMRILRDSLPVYLQMMDPTLDGPGGEDQLAVFSVLNRLGVISVRPILLAIRDTPDSATGMKQILKIVVRRMVVGNLGTGNVERRFGQAAQRIFESGTWKSALESLADLDPEREDFESQLQKRSLNTNVLAVLRQSIVQQTIVPDNVGYLYLIRPKHVNWGEDFSEDRATYWASTIGNTFLATEERRPKGSGNWQGFKELLIPKAVPGEWVHAISSANAWSDSAVSEIGKSLAESASQVWYD